MGTTSDFRVPLSGEALEVIAEARKFARDGFLFPGLRKGVISDMTLTQFMDRRVLTVSGVPPLKWSAWKVHVNRNSGGSENGKQTSEARGDRLEAAPGRGAAGA
ncbi:MAG: hypothetical protein ACFB03_07800, partial [Paracoccaceae bacterium]